MTLLLGAPRPPVDPPSLLVQVLPLAEGLSDERAMEALRFEPPKRSPRGFGSTTAATGEADRRLGGRGSATRLRHVEVLQDLAKRSVSVLAPVPSTSPEDETIPKEAFAIDLETNKLGV